MFNFVTDYWFWGSLGFILGSALGVRNMLKNNCPFPVAVIAITVGVYGGLLATRALYVLIFYPWAFRDNLLLALAFWQQTGTWLGAPLGGAIGIIIVLKLFKLPVWPNLGCNGPGLALAHAICRIGCLFEGCCYGTPMSLPWAIYSKKLNAWVHPTQIYSIIGEAISLAILQSLWTKPRYRKYLYPGYILLLATHRFIGEFYRGEDPGPEIIAGLTVYQTICVFLFVISLSVILILKSRKLGAILTAALVLLTAFIIIAFRPVSDTALAVQRKDAKLYLVATGRIFTGRLDKWKAQHQKDGFNVVVSGWSNPPSTAQVRAWIKEQVLLAGRPCSYILIIGDCANQKDEVAAWHVPSVMHSFEYGGRQKDFITDALYGDLDGDNCPDVPVGRLPVRNIAQLNIQIAKILDHNHRTPHPEWFRAVIWAGAKGYTSQISYILTSLADTLPKWMDQFLISADTSSPYCGNPPDQPKIFLEQFNQPAFLSVITSHGSFRSITAGAYEGKDIFLCVEDVAAIESQKPSGLLVLLGCDSGKFDMPQVDGQSLAEAFAAHPGGPIGVLAATASTNPLTNYFITKAMMHHIPRSPQTVGDFALGIQRRLFREGQRSLSQLAQDDELAKRLLTNVPADEQDTLLIPQLARYEVLMYNLIGDPSCKLNLPAQMSLSVMASEEGEMIVSGETETQCSQLFVQMIKADPKRNVTKTLSSEKERKETFSKLNQRPQTLLNQLLSEKTWKAHLFVPCEYFGNKDYLRFIAIGRQRCYIGLHGVYREKPFADRYIQKETK